MNLHKLIQELKRDEGVRSKVYEDSVGILTIGVGRNLEERGLSNDEIDYLLKNDIKTASQDARQLVSSFDELSDTRQRVLVNMAFNLGRTRLGCFKRMLKAIEREEWEEAAEEMLDSKWADQVGPRARRLAEMMRAG